MLSARWRHMRAYGFYTLQLRQACACRVSLVSSACWWKPCTAADSCAATLCLPCMACSCVCVFWTLRVRAARPALLRRQEQRRTAAGQRTAARVLRERGRGARRKTPHSTELESHRLNLFKRHAWQARQTCIPPCLSHYRVVVVVVVVGYTFGMTASTGSVTLVQAGAANQSRA